MGRCQRVRNALLLLFLCTAMHASFQGSVPDDDSGVIVENVMKDFEGDKAGLQEGDIILSWSRSDVRGEIRTPFDLSRVEIEEAPRGKVTLVGLRRAKSQNWILGPAYWRIKSRPSSPNFPIVTYQRGKELANGGSVVGAAEILESAALQSRQTGFFLSAAWLYYQSAEMLAAIQEWKHANRAYAEAVESAAMDPSSSAQILEAWGNACKQNGDWQTARKNYEHALAESTKTGNTSLSTAVLLSDLFNLALQQGELTRAEDYARQARIVREKLAPDSLPLADSFNDLAHIAAVTGQIDQAENYLTQELALARKAFSGSLGVAKALDGLGVIAWQRGNLDLAQDYDLQALSIRERLEPEGLNVAITSTNLGNIAHQRGDLRRAEIYHRRAMAIIEKISPASREIAMCLNNLGNVASERGDLIRAEDYHARSLTISEKIAPGSVYVASSLTNLGLIATERGDFAKAEAYLRRALEIREKLAPAAIETALNLRNLGFALEESRNFSAAERCYRQALSIREKKAPVSLHVAESENDLGRIALVRGDLREAEDYFRRALDIRKALAPGGFYHSESLAALATVMRRSGRLDDAQQLFQEAIDALDHQTTRLGGEDDVRASYRAKHSDYYSDYIELLLQQKQPEIAFEVMEHSLARILLETLAEARVDLHTGVDSTLLDQERSLRESFATKSNQRVRLLSGKHTDEQASVINQALSRLAGEYQQVQDEIRTKSPQYAALTQPRTLKASEVQQLLDSDTTLLEYALGEQRSFVWVVTSRTLICRELAGRARIERAARRLYRLITAPNSRLKNETASQRRTRLKRAEAQYPLAAADLSRMLLGPIASELQAKRLLIVSDGAVQYVPFALLTAAPKATDRSTPRPLIVDHEIVNLPSASTLTLLRQRMINQHDPPKAVAVLADPVFERTDPRVNRGNYDLNAVGHSNKTDQADLLAADQLDRSIRDIGLTANGGLSLPRLPFTRQEANAIMAITPSGQALDALDFKATRAQALSPQLAQYRIVHFATHGLLNSEHPELSGLVLSLVNERGEPQNGFLSLEDIYNLNLPVDLVVLSACETGLGKAIKREGLLSLTRGFMHAGAARVVASSWKIDDIATATLMEKFYEAMERDHIPAAAALRAAQIQMLRQKRWSLPYFWAAFQIHGEWK